MELRRRFQSRTAAAAVAGDGLARALERLNLTPTGLAAFVLVVAGWFAARLIGSKTMYLMVYAAVLTIVLSWVASRRRLNIVVQRSELPARMRVGQSVDVELNITANRKVATVMLEEHVPQALGRPVRIPIGRLATAATLDHRYRLAPTRRGVYEVGPMTATWSDPFGFTRHKQVIPEPTEIVVHPVTELVHDRVLTRMWEDPPIRPPVSKPWPVGFEFYGMRDYVPGDDPRRVVWSVLAKSGRLMVRESEQGITDRVVIVLDTFAEWHSAGEVSATFETAVSIVSSLGIRHLSDGLSVTVMTGEGRIATDLRGFQARTTLLDTMAALERGTTPLLKASHLLLEEMRSHPHILVVTPHLDERDAKQLKLITDRGLSVLVVNVVWEESDPRSAARAVAAGARVVQVEAGESIGAVFDYRARPVGAR